MKLLVLDVIVTKVYMQQQEKIIHNKASEELIFEYFSQIKPLVPITTNQTEVRT